MTALWSGADFAHLSWHDDTLHALRLATAEPDLGDWRSDLVLDIDHIVEWLCAADRSVQFRVAPADLVFHDVTDLSLDLSWGESAFTTGLCEVSIDRIERRPLDTRSRPGGPYYAWRIETNGPPRGAIAFGASGFTQTLRGEALVIDRQTLTRAERSRYPAPAYP